MKTFFGFVLFVLLVSSCTKDEVILPSPQEDYRNQLIGTYTGNFEHSDPSDTKKDAIIRPYQQVEITKAEGDASSIIINGNPMNVIPQSKQDKNQYSDVFLYSAQGCSGTESYLLEFHPDKSYLVLEYKHERACDLEKKQQKSIFKGYKQ